MENYFHFVYFYCFRCYYCFYCCRCYCYCCCYCRCFLLLLLSVFCYLSKLPTILVSKIVILLIAEKMLFLCNNLLFFASILGGFLHLQHSNYFALFLTVHSYYCFSEMNSYLTNRWNFHYLIIYYYYFCYYRKNYT